MRRTPSSDGPPRPPKVPESPRSGESTPHRLRMTGQYEDVRDQFAPSRADLRKARSLVAGRAHPLPRDTPRHLRLVGQRDARQMPANRTNAQEQALLGPTDPRWVLALRVAEQLQGTVLSPESRERLIRTGKTMGLTPFDANLVIAIIQDQARRGFAPERCASAGAPMLRMVPLPRPTDRFVGSFTRQGFWVAGALVVGIVILEVMLLKSWLGW